jgi:beta-galactosidase
MPDPVFPCKILLSDGWRFSLDEAVSHETTGWTPDEAGLLNFDGVGRLPNCLNWLKAGRSYGPAAGDYDDGEWRRVSVPHDWCVEQSPDRSASIRNGFLPAGVAWYRRELDVRHREGQTVRLRFDGVFRDCSVFLNGHLAGQNQSGYVPFECDLTPLLEADKPNQLAVRVDASGKEGWFYEGAGIYRPVELVVSGTSQLVTNGLRVVPRPADERLTKPVPVALSAECLNANRTAVEATVTFRVRGHGFDRSVATTLTLPPARSVSAKAEITIDDPHAWSCETPNLYDVTAMLTLDGEAHDEQHARTGLRTIRFEADRGFFPNGEPLKLKGVCCHQDHAGVGSAVPPELERWRLTRLIEMGTNAYRCAHNPPSKTLLEACDELGVLVMDETRAFGTSGEALFQLRQLVRRDRNHPSVILWSLANEEMACHTTDVGRRIFERMKQEVLVLDDTRPFTAGVNNDWDVPTGLIEAEDVHGINYLPNASLDKLRERRPDLPVVVAEASSAISTRGVYETDPPAGTVSEYDDHAQPDHEHVVNWPYWGQAAEPSWRTVAANDYLAGTFVWTGFDYRGEQSPYVRWPSVGSHFGIMDLCGFAKDRWHYYRSWWRDEPHVHLLPHWTWPGCEGETIDVWCYSNAQRVELKLNGECLGCRQVPKNGHAEWKVFYRPGVLEAIATFADGTTRTTRRETTGPARAVELTSDTVGNLAVVTARVVDAGGRTCPHADHDLTFTLDGRARIIGLGNGDPNSHEPDQPQRGVGRRRVFHGLAQVLVQVESESTTLACRTDSFPAATLELAPASPTPKATGIPAHSS